MSTLGLIIVGLCLIRIFGPRVLEAAIMLWDWISVSGEINALTPGTVSYIPTPSLPPPRIQPVREYVCMDQEMKELVRYMYYDPRGRRFCVDEHHVDGASPKLKELIANRLCNPSTEKNP